MEREFRRYLDCGILDHGFARAHCALVASDTHPQPRAMLHSHVLAPISRQHGAAVE